MRWLIVVPAIRPGHIGPDFGEALTARGHAVRLFAYRRSNVLYKNKPTKRLYQSWLCARLERLCAAWLPERVMVIKGGPIAPPTIARMRATGALVLNVFPDNPLWMIPFACVEPYDLFFTKEPYALRSLASVGLRNLRYLPAYCLPARHHPVVLTDDERARFASPLSLVGSHYDYRERLVRELARHPLRVWGRGWRRAADPAVRALAGGYVDGRDKLCVYSGSTISLNHHHPMNDIAGTNVRTFELAAAGVCQIADFRDDLATLFKPGEEILTYRDLPELERLLAHYLRRPDEARAIADNARRRALAEHTIEHRLDEILATLDERFPGR